MALGERKKGRGYLVMTRIWQIIDAYGEWLDAPGREHFGRSVWRLVWSVALFLLLTGTVVGALVEFIQR